MTWDCEAYGPEGKTFDALCFFAEPGARACDTHDECHARLANERVRVFDRLQELDAVGDPTGRYLASAFTDPEELLGGGEPPQNLGGSDYVRAVIDELIALGVPVDLNGLDLDEEQSNIPIATAGEIVWLHWLDDPEYGWHLDDEHGRRCAPLCAPDTPPAEAARIIVNYV